MKVWILSSMFPSEGQYHAGAFVLAQAKALVSAGCDVSVIVPVPWAPRILWGHAKWRHYGTLPVRDNYGGVKVYRPRYFRFPGTAFSEVEPQSLFASVKRFLRTLLQEQGRPDVIHAHRLLPEGWVGAQLRRTLGVPVVVTGHGSDVYSVPFRSTGLAALARHTVAGVDTIVTVSSPNAAFLGQLGASDVEIIPNGFEASHYNGVPPQSAGRRLCYVGRLDRAKGVLDLIEAYRQLANEVEGCSLTLVGDGPERAAVMEYAERHGLRDLSITGFVPHNTVPGILQKHDLFVLASYAEGLPTAMIEAMAAGLGLVVTPVGGIPDVVRDGVNGLFVQPGDVHGLYKALRRFVVDEQFQLAARSEAFRAVWDDFTWKSVASRLLTKYMELVATDR